MHYMLTNDETHMANEWRKYEGYTVRPLPSTISYYQRWITKRKFNSSMIYGGTPEIRSVFQTAKQSLVIVDRSHQVVRAMGRLTRDQMPIARNESFIHSDWLDTKKINKKFDLLIGDDAINMVNWAEFGSFIKNAYDLLNDQGIFICHLLVKPDDYLINQKVHHLVDEYKRGLILSPFDLASRLNFICFDKQSYAMGWQQTIALLGREKLSVFKPDLDFIQTFGCCNSRFFCPPQREFEDLVKDYFEIEEIFYPNGMSIVYLSRSIS